MGDLLEFLAIHCWADWDVTQCHMGLPWFQVMGAPLSEDPSWAPRIAGQQTKKTPSSSESRKAIILPHQVPKRWTASSKPLPHRPPAIGWEAATIGWNGGRPPGDFELRCSGAGFSFSVFFITFSCEWNEGFGGCTPMSVARLHHFFWHCVHKPFSQLKIMLPTSCRLLWHPSCPIFHMAILPGCSRIKTLKSDWNQILSWNFWKIACIVRQL
jgi:hypothetical protein